jgi:hypothetical protein
MPHKSKIKSAWFFSFLGSFYSYGSTPIAVSLSILFCINKQYKKMFIILIPNVLYIIYYVATTRLFDISNDKISSNIDITVLIKQYILQVLTFVDAIIGPSFWFKIFYSISSLSVISVCIGLILTCLFYKYYVPKKESINKQLVFILLTLLLLAFGMFALTGLYPQIAFNLGNRVTIYGSLLISFLVVSLFLNSKKTATIVFVIFIFSTLGLSDHWKNWNKTQLQIIENISNNRDIKKFDKSKQLFVTYNQYSQLGKISHIEFLTSGVSSHIFKLATNSNYKVSELNKRFIYNSNKITDKKYKISYGINNEMYVYDSKQDKLLTIKKENIQKYIDSLPKNNRHWLLLLDKDNFIMKIVLKLMPRLEYAL